MASVAEAQGQQSALSAALQQGLDAIDRSQVVVFRQYAKIVLSNDGTVFWSATGTTLTAPGSLHYATDRHQDEDQTIGVNHVIFTSEEEVTDFNAISPSLLWVGTQPSDDPNVPLQVVFSRRSNYYQQADIWHYVGDAVYPALTAQLISSPNDLPAGPIVSNSLPIWLSQNSFAPVYPSFLVPDNVIPPYIVAHVEPTMTRALQAFPTYTWPGVTVPNSGASPMHNLASEQLAADLVRLTLYGFSNQTAIQYYASLIDYSYNTDAFGFMTSPAIRDDKRTQVEIAAVAQKKTIEITASYYQSTADAVARRLILAASITTTPVSFQS